MKKEKLDSDDDTVDLSQGACSQTQVPQTSSGDVSLSSLRASQELRQCVVERMQNLGLTDPEDGDGPNRSFSGTTGGIQFGRNEMVQYVVDILTSSPDRLSTCSMYQAGTCSQ